MNETQREAQEVIHNMTAAYRNKEITFWQWFWLVRLPILDGYLSGWKDA